MFQHRQVSSTSAPPFLTPLNTDVVELRLGPGTCCLDTQEGQAQLRLGCPLCSPNRPIRESRRPGRGPRGDRHPGNSLLSCPFPTFI